MRLSPQYSIAAGCLLIGLASLSSGNLLSLWKRPIPISEGAQSGAWKAPYEILPVPASADVLQATLGDKEEGVFLDGDVLTILRREKGNGVAVTGGIQLPLNRIPGSDLFVLQLKMANWQDAFFTYEFVSSNDSVTIHQVKKLTFKIWRGSRAPAALEKTDDFKGKIVERTIHSKALNEDRKLSIYIPPGAPNKGLKAIFMADGQGCRQFAQYLEPLILEHKIAPAAIVGVYSGDYLGDRTKPFDPLKDLRMLEYAEGWDRGRFDKHMTFFTKEVPAWATKEYGISSLRADRAVFGFSNGGAFSAAAAVIRPEVFGYAMPFSMGILPTEPKPNSPMPELYFVAGTLETFSRSTGKFYEKTRGWGAKAHFDLYVSGHDPEMWTQGLVKDVQLIFPAAK